MSHAVYSVYVAGKPFVTRDDCNYTRRDVVAFEGKVRVVAKPDDFFGGDESQPYKSRLLTNPTWGTLFACLKSQMKKTRDYHHAFLEGARCIDRRVENGETVKIVELLLGS